ncbi:transporter substrate-binding domain-containing protein [Soehngenia saccharolytica]|jgi:polar amino acid transport system substrate-binding protein|nr:transporter substrate-binding domain-containing protein [Soehngenia saccharolytica]
MNKKLIVLIVLTMVAVALSSCTANADKTSISKFEDIKESGKLVLGTAADYPPYEYHKMENGKDQIVGFDIEIAKEIAKDLGVELEIIDMKFEGLLPALTMGDIDLIVAGLVPNEERAKVVDFSIPYYEAEQALLVRTEDLDELQSIDDFAGLNIGAQKATLQEEIALDKFNKANYIGLSKITDLILELKNNKVDGVVLVEPVAKAYAAQNSDLSLSKIDLGKEDGVAVAVNKGNEDLLKSINSTISRLIENKTMDEFIKSASIE